MYRVTISYKGYDYFGKPFDDDKLKENDEGISMILSNHPSHLRFECQGGTIVYFTQPSEAVISIERVRDATTKQQ
jgi:hypothetical protein